MKRVSWTKIRNEYVAGGISYKKLAEKHGVPFGTLRTRAQNEHWHDLKAQSQAKAMQKSVDIISDKAAERAENIQTAADRLLATLNQFLNEHGQDGGDISAKAIRELTAALKDLQTVQHIKSDIDLREQEARIKNLEKTAKEEEKDNKIVLTIQGGDDLSG